MGRSNIGHVILKINSLWILLISIAFIFAYYDTMTTFIKTWSGRNDYSHGYIVPFASLYFIYAMRDRLKEVTIHPNLIVGLPVTVSGVLILMLGTTGSMTTIQQLSILIVIPGLVIMLLGIQMLKALLLPLGYLMLMVPLIFDVVFTPLHWPFQLFGAKIAAVILSAFGIPVYHTAQYIELPNMPLEVANACSGIRYLVSIVALAVPLAYFTQKTWSNKIILVVLSLLIGILTNPIRIAIIGVWAYKGGSILHGPGHILQGYFVSIVAYAFLFVTAYVMNNLQTTRMKEEGRSKLLEEVDAQGRLQDWMSTVQIQRKVWVCGILIMLVAGIFTNSYRPIPMPLRAKQDVLPLELEDWRGTVLGNTFYGIVSLPSPDVEIKRAYSRMSNETLYLQAGYYEYQKPEKKYIHHTLQMLYDGAETIQVEVAPGQQIAAKQVIIMEGGKRQLVTYWYDIDGYVTSDNIKSILINALHGFVRWQTNGSIVLIASELNASDSIDKTALVHEKYVRAIYPFLKEYLNSY